MNFKDIQITVGKYSFDGSLIMDNGKMSFYGTFTVGWDGTHPIVSINNMYTRGDYTNNYIDIYKFARIIESTDDGTWYKDYINEKSCRRL